MRGVVRRKCFLMFLLDRRGAFGSQGIMDPGRSIPPVRTSSAQPVAAVLPPIPEDLAACQALIRQVHESLIVAQQRNDQLTHRLAVLLKARFGPRADRLDPDQLTLFAGALIDKAAATPEPPAETPAKGKAGKARGNGHGRRRFPEELPRVEVVHDLSEEQKPCPCCGQVREQVSQEVHEQLELKPAELFVLKHIRPTYACRDCQGQRTTASKPARVCWPMRSSASSGIISRCTARRRVGLGRVRRCPARRSAGGWAVAAAWCYRCRT